MSHFDFITARKITCAPGAAGRLADHCQELDIHRPMLVTDPGLIEAGIIETVTGPLEAAGINPVVFHDVVADPPEEVVMASVDVARESQVDGIVAVGGGSSMDVAKLIAILANSDQSLADIYGIDNVRGGRLPLILVPTTAGTGSEVTPISIITTGANSKMGVISPQLLPDIAVLDAQLTVGLPPHVTAATGVDAMVHAIESYTSRHKKNVYSDVLAREALRLMSRSINEAVHNGDNLEARSDMLVGAMLAGQAFANSPVAAVHALAYPLGSNYHIPHGLSNSLVLPHVLRFNAPQASHLYAELLPCVTGGRQTASGEEGCVQFIEYIEQLIDDVELPKTLRELDVPEFDLERLADEAMEQQRLLVNNPRDVSRNDALSIYRLTY